MHPGTFGIRNKQEVLVTGLSVLKQAEVGVPVAELIRQTEITEQTYYRWKAKYAGLEVDQVRQIKQLREENTKLKQLVAELTLDKTMRQDVLRKSCKALSAPPVGRAIEEGLHQATAPVLHRPSLR
jgi:putative transposase